MSEFVAVMAHCIGCGRPFAFNPVRVPSMRVNGVREPICRECVTRINRNKVKRGEEPFAIAPDAYEAVSEDEL